MATHSSPFGFPSFDPSKMDPKLLMELSQLIQQLPPEQLGKMQSLMHNMMAGHDVRQEMQEFEKNLPPSFRIRMATLMAGQTGSHTPAPSTSDKSSPSTANLEILPSLHPEDDSIEEPSQMDASQMNVRQARLTILNAVATGQMTPEEAEKLLFA